MGEGAKVVTTGIQDARDRLKFYVDAALEQGQHTAIERHGRPVAVLVPVAWYVSKGGDPREPLTEIAPQAE
jgi:prevent-host-death family protein